ncbi:hypothetical protein AHAS_Ahas05G0061500 [Arachis hypogaea]
MATKRRLYRRIILLEPHFGTNAQGQAQEHPPHYHQHLPLLLDENADSPRTDKVESIQDRILPLLDELKETTINSGNENDVLGQKCYQRTYQASTSLKRFGEIWSR